MRFRVLGDVEVFDGTEWVPFAAQKGRSLLAVLLVRAPAAVSVDRLIFELWGDEPPKTATTQIHGYVMRLRRTLGDSAGRLLVTAAPGYRLAVGDQDVDVQVFQRLIEDGRAALAAGQAERAAELLGAGLALWRGPALADVPATRLVTAEADRLNEHRLAAWDARIEADLRCGRHAALIGELEGYVERHPLREEPWRQLMLALHRSGRRTEALRTFERLRERLIEEVGVEPGAAVRELHRALLGSREAGGRPVPRQLPAAPWFIGRSDELKVLDELIGIAGGPGATMVISAIAGAAGVGKTALAVHWAHRAADRFPDGQLYVNLRGYDAGPPVPPAAALSQFLHALGVAADQIPHETDERAARYRTLLADRRMLVVLDNASDADQVRPLLPDSPGCLTLITSRDDLRALTATHGLHLDVLRHDDALALLADVLGADRANSDSGNLAELARLCGHLPLALRIAGANLAVRPHQTIAGHVAELRDGNLLGRLAIPGDRRAAVRAAFDQSYATLSEPAQRLFRLMGVAPGTDFTAPTAAALLDTTPADAVPVLDQLAAAHMIEPVEPNRFTFHDLVRAYASTLAEQQHPEAQQEALTRLFDHYLGTAGAAMDHFAPYERSSRPPLGNPDASTVDFGDRESATAWLDAERDNLLAAAAHAARHGWPTHTIHLAAVLSRYLDTRAHWDSLLGLHERALTAARLQNDLAAQCTIMHNLGATCRRMGRLPEALKHFQASRALSRQLGDVSSEARNVFLIAVVHQFLGNYPDGVDHLRQARELFERIGDRSGLAGVLYNLGNLHRRTGHHTEALGFLQQALALAREVGNQATEGNILCGIGLVNLRLDRLDEAIDYFTQGLAVARALANPTVEAFSLNSLGQAHRARGRYAESLGRHQEALAVALRIGDRNAEFEARCGIGETQHAAGRPGEALRSTKAALALAVELRVMPDEARAHDSLAGIHAELGEHDHARDHWRRALAIYTELGDPEADRVSRRLEDLQTGHQA